jgi:hypothetical protein
MATCETMEKMVLKMSELSSHMLFAQIFKPNADQVVGDG